MDSTTVTTTCPACGEPLTVGAWPFCQSRTNPSGHAPFRQPVTEWHPSESILTYEHPATGEIRYPGRNDRPMPEMYRRAGFQPVLRRSLHAAATLEKTRKVAIEALHFDRGTGNSF